MFVLHVVYRSYFSVFLFFFFFNDTATTEIYTLSLHDALPIYHVEVHHRDGPRERHYRPAHVVTRADQAKLFGADRKSTRLNSSHLVISYAVFCLKKKKYYRNHHSLYVSACSQSTRIRDTSMLR